MPAKLKKHLWKQNIRAANHFH